MEEKLICELIQTALSQLASMGSADKMEFYHKSTVPNHKDWSIMKKAYSAEERFKR